MSLSSTLFPFFLINMKLFFLNLILKLLLSGFIVHDPVQEFLTLLLVYYSFVKFFFLSVFISLRGTSYFFLKHRKMRGRKTIVRRRSSVRNSLLFNKLHSRDGKWWVHFQKL